MRNKYLILAAISCCSAIATAQEYLRVGEHVIPVEEIDSITFENNYVEDFLPAHIVADPNVSIFSSALKLTGLDKLLNVYMDYNYSIGRRSDDWELGHTWITAGGCYHNVAYPKYRYINFTVFAEPDSVYARNGINSLNDLKVYAAKIYDEMYPEDAGIQDPIDRRNSLNRFVAYHILNRRGEYDKLTNADISSNFRRDLQDMADWYETLMPHSILKCSFPDCEQSGLYINRRGVQDHADLRGVFVKGAKVLRSGGEEGYEIGASHGIVNGMYYYIDDIITYGRQTQEVVLDERMRIDCTTLSPDFMTSGARGHGTLWAETDYKFGLYSSKDTKKNNTCCGFDTVANFELGDLNGFFVSNRYSQFWSYQGDFINLEKKAHSGDVVTFKLPSVPAGTYELRMGVCVGAATNGVLKFYLDDEECGEAVDFCASGKSLGWKSPDYFYTYAPYGILNEYEEFLWKDWKEGDDDPVDTEEKRQAFSANAKNEFIKSFREKGWMYGPASYGYSSSFGTSLSESFYELSDVLRRIITTFTTDGKTDHYLRIFYEREGQTAVGSGGEFSFNLDYIELCPSSVYDNKLYPEDEY